MFEVDVNGLTQQYRTKPTMNVDITGSSGSIPKPLTYDYMPEGYPKKSEETVTTEVDITWDGNTSGLVASSQNHLYRVSDAVYTLEQLEKMHYVSEGNDISVASDIEEYGFPPRDLENGLLPIRAGEQFVIVTEEAVRKGATITGGAPDTFSEPGVYFAKVGDFVPVTRLYTPEPIVETVTTIVPMSSQFMPSDYPNEARVTEMINTALGVIENGSY